MNEDLRESSSLGTGYGEPIGEDETYKSLNTSTWQCINEEEHKSSAGLWASLDLWTVVFCEVDGEVWVDVLKDSVASEADSHLLEANAIKQDRKHSEILSQQYAQTFYASF